MRVAVMAAGAMGGYFGGRMAAAGHHVVFIARVALSDCSYISPMTTPAATEENAFRKDQIATGAEFYAVNYSLRR
jgi:predicted dinucleotide-binding enzyme